jgi:carboxymethylenebutenolidase
MKTITQTILIPHPDKTGRTFNGYLAMPNDAQNLPGVLVLHEAYGLNENIRDITERFAREGYVALAADLLSDGNRAVCLFRAFYGLLVAPLNNGTARTVRAAFAHLQTLDGVDAKRVGAIGFCMGGSYAIQLACLDNAVRAISVASAQNPRPQDALARACPLVGSYAEKDFTTNAGRQLDALLDQYNIPHDIKIYPNGIHSLFNDRAKNFDAQIAADAWQRTLQFFDQHIKTVHS